MHKSPFALMLTLCMAMVMNTHAQQPLPANNIAKTNTTLPSRNNQYRAAYTFTILTGTNNTYGYDVLKNGVVVVH